MADYTIEIYRLDNGVYTRIDSLITQSPFSYANSLCGVGGSLISFDIYDPKATRDNFVRFRNHIAVKRNDTVVWFGPITDVFFDYQDIEGSIRIQANTMLAHFIEIDKSGRYTDKLQTYSQIEQSEIAWDLINHTQLRDNGSLGIVQGNNPTGQLRDRTYEYANVGQALINLSNVINGIEFDFVPIVDGANLVTGVRFDVYYPQMGSLRTDLNTLKIGDNIQSLSGKTNKAIANNGISEGAGSGDTIISIYNETGSQVAYTRRELLYPQKDVSIQSTLDKNLEGVINPRIVENYKCDIVLYANTYPEYGTYSLGDRLYLDFGITGTNYLAGIKEIRMIGISVDVDEVGHEIIYPTIEILN